MGRDFRGFIDIFIDIIEERGTILRSTDFYWRWPQDRRSMSDLSAENISSCSCFRYLFCMFKKVPCGGLASCGGSSPFDSKDI